MLHQSRLRCLALENWVEHQSNHGTAHRQQGCKGFQSCCQVGGICRKHCAVKGEDDIPQSLKQCNYCKLKLSKGSKVIENTLACMGLIKPKPKMLRQSKTLLGTTSKLLLPLQKKRNGTIHALRDLLQLAMLFQPLVNVLRALPKFSNRKQNTK